MLQLGGGCKPKHVALTSNAFMHKDPSWLFVIVCKEKALGAYGRNIVTILGILELVHICHGSGWP